MDEVDNRAKTYNCKIQDFIFQAHTMHILARTRAFTLLCVYRLVNLQTTGSYLHE